MNELFGGGLSLIVALATFMQVFTTMPGLERFCISTQFQNLRLYAKKERKCSSQPAGRKCWSRDNETAIRGAKFEELVDTYPKKKDYEII